MLRDTSVINFMLYLCDNQVLLKAVKRRIGERLVKAPNEDILLEAIALKLQYRTTAGTATFLVIVKAHRGEPANEKARVEADKAILSRYVFMKWHDRTNRAVFTWQDCQKGSKVSHED